VGQVFVEHVELLLTAAEFLRNRFVVGGRHNKEAASSLEPVESVYQNNSA